MSKTARISIVLPTELKHRMEALKDKNWSEVAVKAFEAELRFMFGADNTLQEQVKRRLSEVIDEMLA